MKKIDFKVAEEFFEFVRSGATTKADGIIH